MDKIEQITGKRTDFYKIDVSTRFLMKLLRGPGDVATSYADTTKAEKVLGWKAERGIEEMCRDAWKWQMGQYF